MENPPAIELQSSKGDAIWIQELLSKETVKIVSARSQEAQDQEAKWAKEKRKKEVEEKLGKEEVVLVADTQPDH